MAQAELFKRYIWLLDLIYRYDGITRPEINQHWHTSSLNHYGEEEIPERTFHRHKIAIEELFDVRIVCDRHGAKGYHLADRENLNQEGILSWLLNAMTINNTVGQYKDLSSRILFERASAGLEYLSPILEAMHDGRMLMINYQSFNMASPAPHEVEPYCLKMYGQRWYLLGRRPDRNVMRTFALDRIKGVELMNVSFSIPVTFDAEKYFENSVGILVEADCPPQTVKIRAVNGSEKYMRSLPIHYSQMEYATGNDMAEFAFYLQPNHDLIQELLKYGEDVTVLKPVWLRDRIREIASRLKDKYK